MDNIYQ